MLVVDYGIGLILKPGIEKEKEAKKPKLLNGFKIASKTGK